MWTTTSASTASVVPSSIFDFTVEDHNKNAVSLRSFRGKGAYLVVNVASQWGLTSTNYKELVEIYSAYEKDLEILAFPCNSFGYQEPGSNEDIQSFCARHNVTFPVFGKLDCVGGEGSSPLFQFLTRKIGGGFFGDNLKWNFHKFLCDKDGIPIKRYGPASNPKSIVPDIENLLNTANTPQNKEEDL